MHKALGESRGALSRSTTSCCAGARSTRNARGLSGAHKHRSRRMRGRSRRGDVRRHAIRSGWSCAVLSLANRGGQSWSGCLDAALRKPAGFGMVRPEDGRSSMFPVTDHVVKHLGTPASISRAARRRAADYLRSWLAGVVDQLASPACRASPRWVSRDRARHARLRTIDRASCGTRITRWNTALPT